MKRMQKGKHHLKTDVVLFSLLLQAIKPDYNNSNILMATYHGLHQSLGNVYNQSLKEVEPLSLFFLLLSSPRNREFFLCTEFQ